MQWTAMSPDQQRRELARLDYDTFSKEAADRLRFQMEIAHGIMRTLMLGNGGAIVAIFTFLGNTGSGSSFAISPPHIWAAFTAFVVGLVLSILCSFGAFFSQAFYTESTIIQAFERQAVMFDVECEQDCTPAFRRGKVAEWIGITFAFLSLAAFIVGSAFALSGVL